MIILYTTRGRFRHGANYYYIRGNKNSHSLRTSALAYVYRLIKTPLQRGKDDLYENDCRIEKINIRDERSNRRRARS